MEDTVIIKEVNKSECCFIALEAHWLCESFGVLCPQCGSCVLCGEMNPQPLPGDEPKRRRVK